MSPVDRAWLRFQAAQEAGAIVSAREAFAEVVGEALTQEYRDGYRHALRDARERLGQWGRADAEVGAATN